MIIGVGRRMRRSAVDTDRCQCGWAPWLSDSTLSKFAGQAQNGTIAAKVNIYTIFKGLSLHIIGRPRAKPIHMLVKVWREA